MRGVGLRRPSECPLSGIGEPARMTGMGAKRTTESGRNRKGCFGPSGLNSGRPSSEPPEDLSLTRVLIPGHILYSSDVLSL